jgi:hypothetical protein
METRYVASDSAAKPKVEQSHVRNKRANERPNTVGNVSQTMHNVGRKEKRNYERDTVRGPVGECTTRDEAGTSHTLTFIRHGDGIEA